MNRLFVGLARLVMPPAGGVPAGSRLALIDGARGIAAMIVIVYHWPYLTLGPADYVANSPRFLDLPGYAVLWPLYRFGDMAVPFFWMLSGLVFATVYFRNGATTREFVETDCGARKRQRGQGPGLPKRANPDDRQARPGKVEMPEAHGLIRQASVPKQHKCRRERHGGHGARRVFFVLLWRKITCRSRFAAPQWLPETVLTVFTFGICRC